MLRLRYEPNELMLYVSLWRLYINITIIILGIIHLNSTQLNSMGLSYLTRNILRLRYEPNRLILSMGL
jgi:hypothetical protein